MLGSRSDTAHGSSSRASLPSWPSCWRCRCWLLRSSLLVSGLRPVDVPNSRPPSLHHLLVDTDRVGFGVGGGGLKSSSGGGRSSRHGLRRDSLASFREFSQFRSFAFSARVVSSPLTRSSSSLKPLTHKPQPTSPPLPNGHHCQPPCHVARAHRRSTPLRAAS